MHNPRFAQPLNFAIVGCGRMGRAHAMRLNADRRARVALLFDENDEAANSLRQSCVPDARVVSEFDDLPETSESVDAAVVCTPTTAHFHQVRACREAGWHVLCEKPLADSRARIEQLVAEAERGGPALSVAYQRRYWSTYRRLRSELQSGRWGRILAVVSHNAERWQQTIAGTWRDDPAVNMGGFLGDAGSHKIDGVFYVTGLQPARVFAESERRGSNVEIVTNVVSRLHAGAGNQQAEPSGLPLSMSFVGNAEAFVEDLHVYCERATWMLRDGRLYLVQNNQVEAIELPREESGPTSVTNPVTGFLDQIVDGLPPVAPPECALPVLDFTDAVLRSHHRGQPVTIDY